MKEQEIKKQVIEYLNSISALSLFTRKDYTEEELIEYCCAIADLFISRATGKSNG